MSGPLAGVRVVDFSAVVSGPFAAMWLADQGADVVKVEALGSGDVTRGMQTAPELGGMAGLYLNCNRGKRSLGIDVTADAGRNVVLDLCRGADVFIQNWRPGVAERLGLGYADVSAVTPNIIYVSISGFGPDGPYAQRRVYDPIIQGLTGHVAVQKNPEIPFPDLVRTIVCDKATALTAAQSVCAALFARERGSGGQHLVIPMLDTAMSFFFPDGFMAKALLDDPRADDRATLATVYRVNPTADGHLVTYVANQAETFGLFRALGHPEWMEDPRFSTPTARRQHLDALGEVLAPAYEEWSTAELSVRLEAEEVPFAPVLNLDELQSDPQIVHNAALRVRHHDVAGRVLEAAPPVRFSTTVPDITRLAPMPGQHTNEVLAEIGRTGDEIAKLRADGVII